MEKSNLVEKENNQQSSSTRPLRKLGLSPVNIDSISIDLAIATEKKAEKCHHFSIRGYVAEMRNKDIKICAPFPLVGDETKWKDQLEPLYVAKFKWWRCQRCVQEIGSAITLEGFPNQEVASPNLNGDGCERTEKNSSAHENGLEVATNQNNGDQILDLVDRHQCQSQEILRDGTASMESKGTELTNICMPNPGNDEAADVVHAIEYPGHRGSGSAEDFPVENDNSSIKEKKNLMKTCETSKDVENDATTTAVEDAAIGNPSVLLANCDNDSFKRDKTMPGDNRHIKQYGNLMVLPRRKTKRTRRMTELLSDTNVGCDQIASDNASAELASTSSERKRKLPKEPSKEMDLRNSEAANVRVSERDAETAMATIEISESESAEDALAGIDFRSHMPLQQTRKRSRSSKLKTKLSNGADGQSSYINIPQKSTFKECFGRDIGLDLSLNSHLNFEHRMDIFNPKKTGICNDDHWKKDGRLIGESSVTGLSFGKNIVSDHNRRTTQEEAILQQKNPLHRQLDLSLSTNKKINKAQGRLEVGDTNTKERSEMMFDRNSSDDIPMEIVELMAKHQYERSLSDAERSSWQVKKIDGRDYEPKRFSEACGNGGMPSLQKENNKWDPVNSRANKNHILAGKRGESHILPLYGTYMQRQQKESYGVQPSTSATIRNYETQNHLGSGDKMLPRSPPNIHVHVLDAYNKSHTNPQLGAKAINIWSPVSPSLMPPRSDTVQTLASQTNTINKNSQQQDMHERKTIRDLDLNVADPNDADLETSIEYPFVTKDEEINIKPKGMGSSDSFSNETIPAMQLLSLMDAGMPSRPPFCIDGKKVLEKPLFPCNNHATFSMGAGSSFHEKRLFPHNHQFKELSGLGPAGTRHVPSAYCGQDFFRSQELAKAKKSSSASQHDVQRATKPAATVSNTILDSDPRQDKRKRILEASTSSWFPLKPSLQSSHHIDTGVYHETVRPEKRVHGDEPCCLNENPADFSIPGAGNVYMICGEDLRFEDNDNWRNKFGGLDLQRTQRVSK